MKIKRTLPQRRALVFIGQSCISDELDRLLENYVEQHRINVEVMVGNKKITGVLGKALHPERIIIRQEGGETPIIMYQDIARLTHDLTPEKTTFLSPDGALA